jgi:hypothetical protein
MNGVREIMILTFCLNIERSLKISSIVMEETITRVSPSMIPLTMSCTWDRWPGTMALACALAGLVPSGEPVSRSAYFFSASGLLSGPIVKTLEKSDTSPHHLLITQPYLRWESELKFLNGPSKTSVQVSVAFVQPCACPTYIA